MNSIRNDREGAGGGSFEMSRARDLADDLMPLSPVDARAIRVALLEDESVRTELAEILLGRAKVMENRQRVRGKIVEARVAPGSSLSLMDATLEALEGHPDHQVAFLAAGLRGSIYQERKESGSQGDEEIASIRRASLHPKVAAEFLEGLGVVRPGERKALTPAEIVEDLRLKPDWQPDGLGREKRVAEALYQFQPDLKVKVVKRQGREKVEDYWTHPRGLSYTTLTLLQKPQDLRRIGH